MNGSTNSGGLTTSHLPPSVLTHTHARRRCSAICKTWGSKPKLCRIDHWLIWSLLCMKCSFFLLAMHCRVYFFGWSHENNHTFKLENSLIRNKDDSRSSHLVTKTPASGSEEHVMINLLAVLGISFSSSTYCRCLDTGRHPIFQPQPGHEGHTYIHTYYYYHFPPHFC